MNPETERAAFLSAIVREPADDTARLVYADWLDEQGEADRAEFIRVQVELAREPHPLVCPKCGNKLVRQPMSSCPDLTRCSTCRYTHRPFWEDTRARIKRFEDLEIRQQQLLADPHNFVNWTPSVMHTGSGAGIRYETGGTVGLFGARFESAEYRRGFVERIVCRANDWLACADAITWHPSQTATCPDCDGKGETRFCDAAGDMDDEPCRRCGGRLAHGYKRGTGRVPRPCPPAAHPVTRVTFSEHDPGEIMVRGDKWPDRVEIKLTQKTEVEPLVLEREEYTHRTGDLLLWRAMVAAVWGKAYPGITFELPP